MSAAKTKLDLSLDDIIKNNKKDQKTGKRNVRTANGPRKSAGLRQKKGQGVLKRRSLGAPKGRAGLNHVKKLGGQKQVNASGTTATQRLVSKLVKKALRQVTATRAPKTVRNVIRGRRGGVRGNRGGQPRGSLNRISQRSRVIGRRSQNLNRSFTSQARRGGNRGIGRRGRGNTRNIVMARREPNPIQAQLNFLRRQQNINQPRPQIQAPVIMHQQQIRRQASARRRQQAARVIYVQQQRPALVRRQPQPQIIYVQQQPRRQFRGGRGGGGGRRPQRRNDPFFEPPNFLQRIPSSNQSFGRGGGGRGRRFIQF